MSEPCCETCKHCCPITGSCEIGKNALCYKNKYPDYVLKQTEIEALKARVAELEGMTDGNSGKEV